MNVLTTLTVKKGASAASVSLKLKADGSYEFVDADGVTVTTHSNEAMRRLFVAINALV
jgi:hypothetical protein